MIPRLLLELERQAKPQNISAPNSLKLVEEVHLARRFKDETSHSRGHQVIWWKPIVEDENDDDDYDLAVLTRPNGESQESVGKARLSRLGVSSTSDDKGK